MKNKTAIIAIGAFVAVLVTIYIVDQLVFGPMLAKQEIKGNKAIESVNKQIEKNKQERIAEEFKLDRKNHYAMNITELGVSVWVPSTLKNATYAVFTRTDNPEIRGGISTAGISAFKGCEASAGSTIQILGMKNPDGVNAPGYYTNGREGVKVGNTYYFLNGGPLTQSPCADLTPLSEAQKQELSAQQVILRDAVKDIYLHPLGQ
jgi:hypothetical protein